MNEQFKTIYSMIQRQGTDRLFEWLQSTDFFTAPASTRFHGSYEGALCEHSINVYTRLLAETKEMEYKAESIAICGLLHDVCKANFYKIEMRNKKNERGEWEQVPFYTVDDKFPYGHGEKSVYIISRFMPLTTEEAMAIRWHMGGFDDSVKGGSYALSGAFEKYPLALLLHIADMKATYLDETRGTES